MVAMLGISCAVIPPEQMKSGGESKRRAVYFWRHFEWLVGLPTTEGRMDDYMDGCLGDGNASGAVNARGITPRS